MSKPRGKDQLKERKLETCLTSCHTATIKKYNLVHKKQHTQFLGTCCRLTGMGK